jgi:DNA-binding winged helix-turn-helix (wHTH) protein/tetratricopeptide (TPR) repeat protein
VRFGFDQYVLDFGQRELRREGQLVPVEPQVLDLIQFLVAERHRVVTKDELIERVWNNRIVSESTLSSRINAARKAIGDSGQEQKLIRTYARRGFRFTGSVEVDRAPAEPAANTTASSRPDELEAVVTAKPILTVMPFRNLSANGQLDWLAQAVTEDVSTALGRHRSITVCSPHATGADDVGGRYLVEGSVRSFGERVRITVQLLGSKVAAQLWAERYDLSAAAPREPLLDEATDRIAARIETEVSACERLRSNHKPERSLSAADYLQLGLQHFYRASPADNLIAQQHFREAIALDGSLAQAHAFLSYALVLAMVYHGSDIDDSLLDEAISLARTATALDERDAMSRFALGRALLARREYRRAMAEMRSALDLNPALAVVHCGLGDSLAYEGRFDEAIPHFEKAIELGSNDPQRWAYMSYRSLAHLFAGDYESAAFWAERATQVPAAHFWPYAHRVSALGHLNSESDIRTAVAELQQLRPDFSCGFARERLFFIKNEAHLRSYLEGLRKAGVPE